MASGASGSTSARARTTSAPKALRTAGPEVVRAARAHDASVAAHCAHDREPDPGVPRARLDDGRAGPKRATLLGIEDHRERRAVLDAPARCERLDLREHLGAALGHDAPQAHERGAADDAEDVGVDHEAWRPLYRRLRRLRERPHIARARPGRTEASPRVYRTRGARVAPEIKRGTLLIDKLAFLVRFWELKTRHATGEPLDDHEQVELLSLLQLVTSELRPPVAGGCARGAGALPGALRGAAHRRGSRVATVELRPRAAGAAALVVAAGQTLPRGARVVLRAADAVAGVEYTLPCVVLWSHGEAAPGHAPGPRGRRRATAARLRRRRRRPCRCRGPSLSPGALVSFGRKARLVA